MHLCLQILSDLKDGGVQGWVYWQVRSQFLNNSCLCVLCMVAIVVVQDSRQACCIMLLPPSREQLLSILLVLRTSLCAGVWLDVGAAGYFL